MAAVGIKYHHDIPIPPLHNINDANVTHTFMQYKQPPNGLVNDRNGFFGLFMYVNTRVQNPNISPGWIKKSMKIETMAAMIPMIAAHETMVNCVGTVIKLATMNPIKIPITIKNVLLIELTILLLFILLGFLN